MLDFKGLTATPPTYLIVNFFLFYLYNTVTFCYSQQQNLSGPNLLGLLNQQSFPQPELSLHNTLLNNTQPGES